MDIRFDDYNAYPDSDIVTVTEKCITLTTGQFIDFAQCADNFHRVHSGSGKCVGEREVTGSDCTIAFYTAPLTTHIVFVSGSRVREFFRRESAVDRFHKLCNQITDAGYTTCDMS